MRTKILLLLTALLIGATLAAPTLAQGGKTLFDWVVTKQLTVTTGGADFQSAVTLTSIDASGSINYGTDNLYPLGIASDGQQIACNSTGTFTGSVVITVTPLTTVSQVLLTQVTAPITTAAFLQTSAPTTKTFTVTSLSNAFEAGTTGVNAFYCAVGTQ